MRATSRSGEAMPYAHEQTNYSEPVTLEPGDPTPWGGFALLAGVFLLIAGAGQVIGGATALLDNGHDPVPADQLAVPLSYTAWGWLHLILGVVVALAGLCVLAGQTWARAVAVVVAILSALVNTTFLKVNAFASVIVIVFDLLVVYSLAAHRARGRHEH
jgi:hypothetical protein